MFEWNLQDKIESSKEIIQGAYKLIKDMYDLDKPYKIVAMLSGGDDSVAVLEVAKILDIKIDYIIHGNTGTGFPATFDYVKWKAQKEEIPLLVSDAKGIYEKRVTTLGFYGSSSQPKAHHMAYNDLKHKRFRALISKEIRHKKRNRPVLLLNGARRSESQRRQQTCKSPYNLNDKPNIWVNLVNDWEKEDELELLEANGVKRNPVSVEWHHSGECNCGTTAPRKQLFEIKEYCPKTYKLLINLENQAIKNGFNWGWGESNPISKKQYKMELKGQLNLFKGDMIMCSGNCAMKHKIDAQKEDFNRSR